MSVEEGMTQQSVYEGFIRISFVTIREYLPRRSAGISDLFSDTGLGDRSSILNEATLDSNRSPRHAGDYPIDVRLKLLYSDYRRPDAFAAVAVKPFLIEPVLHVGEAHFRELVPKIPHH